MQLQLFYKCWDYEQKKKIEHKILNIVKKIPGSSIDKNKRGYNSLLVLDENNSTYKNKVRYYSMTEGERKLMEEQRKKEQENKRKKQEQEQKRKEKKKEQIEARKRSNIKRLYQSTEEYWKVVVAPTRRTKIKCALYDADGQVLVVDEQYVDPPLDEVIIRVPGGYGNDVESVKCWGF